MKKRFLAFLLSGAMLLGTMPAAFAAETITIEDSQDAVTVQDESTGESTATSGTCGEALTWSYDNGTLTISGTGDMADYSDDSSVPWYSYAQSVSSIVVEEGATSIGDYAFYGCVNCKEIKLPSGVTSIGSYAFAGCKMVTSIEIPDSVTSIGRDAFNACVSLESIAIPSGVTSIENNTFDACKNLTSVEIPESVTSIGRSAFDGCTALMSVTIPGSVATIGDCAFNHCEALTSVNIQNGVTTIGTLAFLGCFALTSIEIPESVTTIGFSAFNICRSLTSVTIPGSVTTIEYGAFAQCGSLESIDVVAENTAYTSVDGVLFDKDKETLIAYPAGKKDESYIIPSSVKTVGDEAFMGCVVLTDVTIPNGVATIGRYAFEHTALTSIEIPNSVTSIGSDPFGWCSYLKSIDVADGNEAYISIDGVLFDKNQKTLIQYPAGKTDTSYIIPDGVTTVGSRAFDSCRALQSVTIPGSVTTIEYGAFDYCKALKMIKFMGNAPAIDGEAFGRVNTRAYYPKGNETWISDVLQDYGGVITWLEWDSIQADVTPKDEDGNTVDETLTVTVDTDESSENSAETIIADSAAPVTANQITAKLRTDEAYSDVTVKETEDGKLVTDKGDEVSIDQSVVLETSAALVKSEQTITFTVTPYVITTATVGDTTVQVDKEEIHKITEPVTMTLALPTGFAEVGAKVYVTHKTADGDKLYEATVQQDENNKLYITFENKDGFSDFIVTTEKPKQNCNGNHSYDDGTVTKKATCTETGVKTFTCTVCGETKTEEIEALGHDFCDEGKIIEAATCGKAGKENVTCSRCQTTEAREIPATGKHDYSIEEITQDATCTAEGTKTLTCSVCGDQKTETIQKKDHTEVAISATPATCTEDGLTAGTKCSVCNTVITAQETVKALGHDYKIEVTKEPTTTEKGEKKLTCNRCGDEKLEEIPATGSVHTHTYKPETTKDATCTETGTVTYTCSCGAQYTTSIPAKGHTAESVKATAPTCTENGLTAGKKCSVCGITLEGQEIVKALGHNPVTDPLVKATRTKNGKTEGSHCSTCGEVLVKQETIYKVSKIKLKKKNHTYYGKKHKPGVIVEDSKGNTIDPSNYKVKYYGKRKKVGKYKVTVTLKGDQYKGKKTLYFTVRKK